MKNIFVITISLILLTAGTVLAVKPEDPGGKVDLEAALEAETQARIDGDTALQEQVDGINANIAPHASVMYLRDYTDPPPDCPESWTEANYTGVRSGQYGLNLVRVCYNMDNSCTVMYLEEADFILPPNCPDLWTEAALTTVLVGNIDLNTTRTCYYCAQ